MAKEDRGFASMDRAKQREIASKGGKAAHQKGTAHEWTSEEARDAGRKGGIASHQRRREQMGGGGSEDTASSSTWTTRGILVLTSQCAIRVRPDRCAAPNRCRVRRRHHRRLMTCATTIPSATAGRATSKSTV